MSKLVLCPACLKNEYTPYGEEYDGEHPFPALSRKDNDTHICSPCGMREAFEDMRFGSRKFVYHAVYPEYGSDHAKIAIVMEGEGGYYDTDLDLGDYKQAQKACAAINKLAGINEMETAAIIMESMRLSGFGGR